MAVVPRKPEADTQPHGLRKKNAHELHAAARKKMTDLVAGFNASSSPNDNPAPNVQGSPTHPAGRGDTSGASPAIAVIVTPTRPGLTHSGGGQGPARQPQHDGVVTNEHVTRHPTV